MQKINGRPKNIVVQISTYSYLLRATKLSVNRGKNVKSCRQARGIEHYLHYKILIKIMRCGKTAFFRAF
ncbi:MAG TPA: hypothetical protein VMW84_03200, partial [Acidobacteriota bacterium]|nr:hypothetical protein [Acidobacteriota bacterium]